MFYALMKLVSALVARILFRLETRGAEHLPRSGPALLVANHVSFLDPLVVGAAAPRQLHFMAKAELFRIPLLGLMIRRLHVLPVRRDESDPAALRAALRALEGGHALLVFPEGTRGEEGTLLKGRAGAGLLALLSGAPVIPVYIEGSGRAMPRGRLLPRPAKIRVRFGYPLSFTRLGNGRQKFRSLEVSREMMAAIAALKSGSDQLSAINYQPAEC